MQKVQGINYTIKTKIVNLVRVFMYGTVLVTRLFEEKPSELHCVQNEVLVSLPFVRSWYYCFLLSIVV
jgi:hypothetical protein